VALTVLAVLVVDRQVLAVDHRPSLSAAYAQPIRPPPLLLQWLKLHRSVPGRPTAAFD